MKVLLATIPGQAKTNLRMIKNNFFAFVVTLFIVQILIVGCSSGRLKTEPVGGVVTLDGVPLADATVGFSPVVPGEGAIGFAQTNKNGKYKLQTMNGNPDAGTLPGQYAVIVTKYKTENTGRKTRDSLTGEMVDETKSVLIVPEVYADVRKTPFSAIVVSGKNEFNFEMISK